MGRRIYLVFDVRNDLGQARSFLTELGQQRLDLQVTGASKAEQIADTQRPLVITQRLRAADLVVALISPTAALSRPMAEELGYAIAAKMRIVGVLVGGATPRIALPKGIERTQIYGWDWGTLKRAFR